MMRAVQYSFLTLVLTVLLASCQTMSVPQTNLERLSYLEISYGVLLDKATLYATEGRLSDEQKAKLNTSFDTYEEARTLAKVAIDTADQGSFDTSAAVMTTVLGALRTIVAEVEQ